MIPRVTVIIGYNIDRGWLHEAIESVHHQTYQGEIELLISQSNNGIAYNLNRGIEQATGNFIKYLSEDDLLTPNSIKDSVNAFTTSTDFIHGNAFNFKVNGQGLRVNETQSPVHRYPTLQQMLFNNVIHGGTVMYRKSFFEKYGLFDESLTCAEEYDLHLRALKKGAQLDYTNCFLYYYRRHDKQKSLGKGIDQVARKIKIDAIKQRYR